MDITHPSEFEVSGGPLRLYEFQLENIKCLSLFITMISHHLTNGNHISCVMLYYVENLLQRPRLIKWDNILL